MIQAGGTGHGEPIIILGLLREDIERLQHDEPIQETQ